MSSVDGLIDSEVLSFNGIDYNYVTDDDGLRESDFPVVIFEDTSKRSVTRFVTHGSGKGRLFRLERCEISR
jgi:hypothetical protein